MKSIYSKILLFIAVVVFPFAMFAADSNVRINSIGFLPNNAKRFTCNVSATNFTVVRVSDSATVYSGTLGGAVAASDSGETVYKGDFSSFTTPGVYRVNVTGVGNSVNFVIADNAYNQTFIDATRAMYLWRCNAAVSGSFTYNGQTNTFSHAACHTNDAYDYVFTPTPNATPVLTPVLKRNGTGGWHDAGDYGKYTVNAGITVGMMFMAWEHFGAKINSLTLGIPETAPGYPEYLKEMKWEIDYVLKMVYPDGTGRVSHKLTRQFFSGFVMPETDTAYRFFTDWGSAATADYVAMLAMAARIFYPYDPVYSQTCIDAAWLSYNFLLNNTANRAPNISVFATGGYGTADSDDRLWAAAEMWATTGSTTAHQDFTTRANTFSDKTDQDWDWGNIKNLGMYTYLMCTRTGKNATILSDIQADLIVDAAALVAAGNNHGYGRPLGNNYYWGCNGAVARSSMNLMIANMVSPNANYVNATLDMLGFIFGRNYNRRSYVTDIGVNAPMNPHDRRSGADGITNPWPGYLVGGSLGTNDSAPGRPANEKDPALYALPAGLPVAQYWVDDQDSYASNEIAINWQGALIYALAAFVNNPATPTPIPTATKTITGTPPTSTITPTYTPIPTVGVVLAECVQGSTFTINGNLNEAAWAGGTWTNVTRTVEGTQGAVSARYKVKWDNTYIYVGVEVTDPVLCNSNATYYQDDSIEIYLDLNHNAGAVYDAYDYQLTIRYGLPTLYVNAGQTSAFTALTALIAGGYSAEYRIPWSDSGLSPYGGMVIGFDVGVNHDEVCGGTRTGVLMWNGTNNNWQNTSAFGDAILQPCAASSPTFTRTRTATPTYTRTRTATPSATASVSPQNTFTRTPTYTRTNTPVNTFTASPVNTGTFTRTATATGTNTRTRTPTPLPTSTSTYTVTLTSTNTFTHTRTASPTSTATPTRTPSFTRTVTSTMTVTQTHSVSPTVTTTWTGTPPTSTFTPTVTQTWTSSPTDTVTQTSTATPTNTPVDTDTVTQTVTETVTLTHTLTATPTGTLSATLTSSPVVTATDTPQGTATDTPVITATNTPVNTATETPVNTATDTAVPTAINTATRTAVPTSTPSFTATLPSTVTFTPTRTRTPQPPTPADTPTSTPVITATPDTFAIVNPSVFPNPYNPATGAAAYFRCDLTQPADKVRVRIYTLGFRAIEEVELQGPFNAGRLDSAIQARDLNKLSNGIYYFVVSGEGSLGGKAKTGPGMIVILR